VAVADADFLLPRWRTRALLACNLLALAVLASWRWPPARAQWDRLDAAAFRFLNAPLAGSDGWARFWSVCNMRPVDLLFGLVMLAFLIKGDWVFPARQVRRALYAFLVVLALVLLIRAGPLGELVKALHWQRASPSLSVDGAVRLAERFPGWEGKWHIKDASGRSFPGDHAAVLLSWALFVSFAARGWRRWLAWGLAIAFMLPRLVSGAHWLSDNLVGGVFVGLMAAGWGACTPFAVKVSTALERLGAPLVRRLGTLPVLRRLSVLSAPDPG